MCLPKKLILFFVLLFTFEAQSQITETRWEIISSQNFDLYLPKSSDIDYYRLLNDVEKHLEYCEVLFDFHLNESIRLVASKNENIVKIPVSLNNSKSTEAEFDRHTGYIVSNTHYETILLQAKNAIVAILLNDLMYGKSLQDRIQNKALLQVPKWFISGMAAYCNEPWMASYDGMLREYFLHQNSPGFNRLIEYNENLAGFSFWKYLTDRYGDQNIANVLYITHLSRSIESGIYFVYGKNIVELMQEWRDYYTVIYQEEFKGYQTTEGARVMHTSKLGNIMVSPDGKWLAGVQYEEFKTKIYCLNLKSSKRTLINTSNGTNEVILRWRDVGKVNELLYKITATGNESIVFYNPSKNRNTKSLKIKDFDKLITFDIDAQGNYVFYGINKSKTYLVQYMGKNQKLNTLLTKATLLDVRLVDSVVYFTTGNDRFNYLIRCSEVFDTLLTIASSSVFNLISIDSANIIYVANSTGLNQVYGFHLSDQSLKALTHFTHQSSAVSCSMIFENCYYAKSTPSSLQTYSIPFLDTDTAELPTAFFTRHRNGIVGDVKNLIDDSISRVQLDTLSDINPRYYFLNGFNEEDERKYQYLIDSMKLALRGNAINLTVSKSYELNFATLKVSLLQLDNSNFFNCVDLAPLNPSGYQYYYYYHYLKSEMALKDILNKYQLFGGFRISTNFGGGYDAYLKFEKTFKRFTLQSSVYYFQKRFYFLDQSVFRHQIQSTNVSYSYRYTNTITLKVGGNIMPYWSTLLSTERNSLNQRNTSTFIIALNTEYQYGKLKKYTDFLFRGITVQVQPQLYYNTRTQHVNGIMKGIIKYYRPLYRKVTWSNQLLFSCSGGAEKVLNILGGAENWIFVKYDEQNQFSEAMHYQLRSYAGAVRGFRENIRSGNNSFCINSELRIPISSLLSKWPTDKNWYQNLLLIPFVDLGSAWNGLNLFNNDNNYSIRLIDYSTSARNIASVEVKNLRAPIIGSFGLGVNTRIIGYNTRFDLAFGVEDGKVRKPMYLLSYGTNF